MSDDLLVKRIRRALEHWEGELPPNTAGRLRAARREAIDSLDTSQNAADIAAKYPTDNPRPASLTGFDFQSAALGFASLAAVALTVGLVLQDVGVNVNTLSPEDRLILSSEDDFEMYREVDFLLWLSEQDDAELG